MEEHVAVLRLYQRFRYRHINVERQTFGLPESVASSLEDFYVLDAAGVVGAGLSRSGVLGEWAFSEADVREWMNDPAFAFLDAQLRKNANERSDAEERLATALGIANIATVALRPPLRHVLYAVALEALLGDTPMADRAHRVAVRAAYLTCDSLGSSPAGLHGPSRPACAFLAYASEPEMRNKIARTQMSGIRTCSYYDDVRDIFGPRNRVLHEALGGHNDRRPASEWRGDEVILGYARAAAQSGFRSLRQLDAQIADLVRASPNLADATFGNWL